MKWLSLASACFLISHLVQCVPVDSDKPAPSVQGKHFDRMVVIVLSDANYADAIKDPYLSTLADRHQGLTLTNYKGLALPSQANYVGMISGSTSGVVLDSDANINDRKTVVDLLESKGISWKTYQEDYTPLADGSCNSAKNIGNYVRYHNPFMAFQSISKSPSRCQYIVPGTQLDVDIKNNAVPQFVFYTPNLHNNGRQSNVSSASSWLKEFLEPKMTQDAFSKDTLVVVTWDKQSSVTTNNHVLTMLLGSMVNRSSKSDGVPYNHYSILKTVQDNWGLPSLGQKDVGATPFILKDLAENGMSEKIKNVVILMFENRSFDRMMGWFDYNSEIDGLTPGKDCNYVNPADPSSLKICATNQGKLKDPLDPGHLYNDTTQQITGNGKLPSNQVTTADMSGFVANFAHNYPGIINNASALHQIMDGFSPDRIPITYELASNYTIFDRWFSSFPGSTMPNRMYLHSATSHGEPDTDSSKYLKGYPQRTIYNNLDDANIPWANYFYEIPSLLLFDELRLGELSHYKNWATFGKDAAAGTLPPVSFLDPAYFSIGTCIVENDAHPPSDVADSEKLLKEVYETVRASPQWNQTLFIVTFDEHGGYYDHVNTPLHAPNPDGLNVSDFNFDRLGLRVPAILISPWVEKGAVIHEAHGPYSDSQYEHSSVPATLKKLFNLPNFLTKRDAWAGTFENAISLDKPRTDCPTVLSDPPAPMTKPTTTNPISQAFCKLIKQILQGKS